MGNGDINDKKSTGTARRKNRLVSLALFILRRISKKVERLEDGSPEKEEFNRLSGSFGNFSEDPGILKDTIRRQQNSIQQMFELHLLNDGIRSEDEWDDYFKTLNLPKYEYFMTAVSVIDVRYNSHIQTAIDEDAISLQLIEDMPDELKSLLWMPPVYNSCTIFSLIGDNDEEALLKKVESYYEGMQKYCSEKTGLYIIMGVSGIHSEHKKIRLAYRESAMAMMYNENTRQDYHEIEQQVI